jgi:hypothetical protein
MRGQYKKSCKYASIVAMSARAPWSHAKLFRSSVRTSGADSQHDRNCVRKKEEVGVEGLGLSV